MWQGWINLILGVWLILSGFISAFRTTANFIIVGILATEIPHPPPESLGFCVSSQWQAAAGGGFSDRQHSPFSILASFWVSTPSGQGWHTVGQLTALEAVLEV